MDAWLGSTWQTVAYVVVSTTAIYCSTLLAVRLAGRRTVAQFSAFDVIVTIALGSVVASTAVSRDPSYAQGMTAVATLLALQVVVGALRRRFVALRRLLDFPPRVVASDGELRLGATPMGPQLTPDEVMSKLRTQGIYSLDGVHLVVMEADGGLSVVPAGVTVEGLDEDG